MDADLVIDIGRQALMVAMLVAAPILLSALLIGLLIGMLQAATQIQEMTLSFIPKLIGMGIAILFFGQFMLQLLVDLFHQMMAYIPVVLGA